MLSTRVADIRKANDLALLATSALEGAIVLARVRRDLTPLDAVHRQLRSVFQAEKGAS